jgi:uncharacterized protein
VSNVEARACNELALMKLDWTQGALAEGRRCYHSREFFAAHEHWESVWLATKGPEKAFLQALIQLAAALHHIQRGNPRGAASLLRSALQRLEPHPLMFGGIADYFRAAVTNYRERGYNPTNGWRV